MRKPTGLFISRASATFFKVGPGTVEFPVTTAVIAVICVCRHVSITNVETYSRRLASRSDRVCWPVPGRRDLSTEVISSDVGVISRSY
jgi:hypothetical protein